jgi:gliding motility-associated-like protein
MKKAVLVGTLIGLTVNFSPGQNLVPNADFEAYKKLPCKLNEFLIQDLLHDWFQPLPTTSDYWNTLGDNSCFLSPAGIDNSFRSGTGSGGLITAYYSKGLASEYKEYLEVKLLEPMKKGGLYTGEFYTRSRGVDFYQNDLLVANNLGLAFADTIVWDYRIGHPDHLIMKADVKALDIVPADGQWHKVSNCFLADKDFQYLLIGNFESVNKTKVIRQSFTYTESVAYYYIDDVHVSALTYDISNLKSEMDFCNDQDNLELTATVKGATRYEWEDGSTDPVFVDKVRSTHSVSVRIFFDECAYVHTFSINYIPDIDLGSDTVLCAEESLLLNVNYPAPQLLWSDGSTDAMRTITYPGIYAVVAPGMCPVMDTITVDFIDCPGFVPNVFTPNKDDHFNPVFEIENITNKRWSLDVFNRWGKIVYQSRDYENDWDGGDLPEGIYYYSLYSPELDKKVKGSVQIIREAK